MRIGLAMRLWADRITEEHLHLLDDLGRAGYDGVEIPVDEGAPEQYRGIARRLSDLGLAASARAALPDATHGCLSAYGFARQRALDYLRRAIARAEALGADVLCGALHHPLHEFAAPAPDEAAWAGCVETHRRVADEAARAGIALSVAAPNRFRGRFLTTAEQACDLVRRVERPNYGFLYSTFDANIEEREPAAAVRASGRAINHVHLGETHLGVPGTGHLDYASVCAALAAAGYGGWLTVVAAGPGDRHRCPASPGAVVAAGTEVVRRALRAASAAPGATRTGPRARRAEPAAGGADTPDPPAAPGEMPPRSAEDANAAIRLRMQRRRALTPGAA